MRISLTDAERAELAAAQRRSNVRQWREKTSRTYPLPP
jgi:hypothetical protein